MYIEYGDTKFYNRLEKYFFSKFFGYAEEAEFETTKKTNEWIFRIPSEQKMVKLTCEDNGDIKEDMKTYIEKGTTFKETL